MGTRIAQYLASVAIASALALPARGETVEEFYKSHPVTMILGYSSGGGFDLYGRTVAKYYGKYLPGHPTIVVQNMPGAGSLLASNHVYNVSPKDGSVVALVRAPVMDPLTGTSNTNFDSTKFTWIGNGMNELTICAQLNNPQIKSMADAQKYPFTMASLGPGSDEDMFTKVLNHLFGLKDKIVSGYPGGAEAVLAIERGEVDGRCGWSWSSLMITRPDWVTSKRLQILASLSLERSPDLPDTPAITEFATTEKQKQILKVLIGCEMLGRPFLAPPGVPADRAAALRKAFDDTMADPAFIADRHAVNEVVNPVGWQYIDNLLKELYATPKDLIEETRAIIAER
jgi:tripartite-type tricarboxylate transporter receptor subunit TctC